MRHRIQAVGHDDHGMTLVELLIVIVVLGVLGGIVVLGVAQFRGDSVSSACEADKNIVTTAANAYNAQKGNYPTKLSDLERAGYVKDPPSGVTYTFDGAHKTVKQGSCTL